MSEGGNEKPGGSLIPVLVVFCFGLAIIVILIGFAGPAGLYIVLALCGVLAFAGLHYILWGWWLSNWIRRQEQSKEDSSADD